MSDFLLKTNSIPNSDRKGRNKKLKKILIIILSIVLSVTVVLGVLQLGVLYNSNASKHWKPDYEMIDISPILEKLELTDEDYKVLYAQTGLTKIGIDDLLEQNNYALILDIQSSYFEDYSLLNNTFAPFSKMQTIDRRAVFANLQEGDIIVSASTFVSWFRCGHAALVVDGEEMKVLNAAMIGENSSTIHLSELNNRANFLVLRPKVSKQAREKVAAFSKEELVGLPYNLTVGIFSGKEEEKITGSHCAHIVWYAYKRHGVDLDSTGGTIVTPKDIANSVDLELVQTFGFDPKDLWK